METSITGLKRSLMAQIRYIHRRSAGKSKRNCPEIDLAVYNFPKVTFPETEHLNWCKEQSSYAEVLNSQAATV